MHPKDLSINDFTYSLPEEQIAAYPLPERDASRLLIYTKGNIKDTHYRNISESLPENSVLYFNNTRVVEARLLFQKETGGVIEIFCLEPDSRYPDITTAMATTQEVYWQCMVGGASKWKSGQVLRKALGGVELQAHFIAKSTDGFIIKLAWGTAISFAEILHRAGAIPLPPYMKRKAAEADTERYQTIYAQMKGSVAAPTAGLHFTERIFNTLSAKNIHREFLTLHVGAGTFKPVKAPTMQEHEMHAEHFEVSVTMLKTLKKYIQEARPVIAVGTTSMRTLESLYWLGVKMKKALQMEESPEMFITQWEAYEEQVTLSTAEALQKLIDYTEKNNEQTLFARTQIIIAPGYTTKIVHALVTNFHQPQSTLLLLVAALVGDDWRKIYTHALNNNYRFLSYGDGSLILL